MNTDLLIIAISLPFIAALAVPFVGMISSKARGYFSSIVTVVIASIIMLTIPTIYSGETIELLFRWIPILHVDFGIYIDGLSILIALIISVLGALASIYSIGFMKDREGSNRYYILLLLFIGSMLGVAFSSNLFLFYVFWELMTLTSWGLVIFYQREEKPLKAGYKYFVMTTAASVWILIAITAIFSYTGTFDMRIVIPLSATGPGWLGPFLLVSLFIGFGIKATIVPLHTWTPAAYSETPAPISAIFSSAMTKLGIYGIVRLFYVMFIPLSFTYPLIAAFGVVTMVIGGMMALIQEDIKRLLAYSSVSQIGYVLLGIGVGTAFGIAGGLFHLLNHAMFKALLFLCAGAVIYRVGTRDINELGGLAKKMPITAACFIIGALAVSGVPPFNGFVSKLMIYEATIEAGGIYYVLCAVAAFVSVITLAYFVKAVHSIFFGQSLENLKEMKEVSPYMYVPMCILAAGCIIFGIFPQLPLRYLVGPAVGVITSGVWTYDILYPIRSDLGIWDAVTATSLLIIGIIVGVLIYYFGMGRSTTSPKIEKTKIFVGGEELAPDELQFSSAHFYSSIKTSLKPFYDLSRAGGFDWIYFNSAAAFERTCEYLRKTHTGSLAMYIAWFMIALILFGMVLLI